VAYSRKLLTAAFQLGKGSFGDGGFDTITIPSADSPQKLRISATINKAGGVSMNTASIKVYGLTLDQMNQLSQLKQPILSGRYNIITLSAGDTDGGMSTAFTGGITESWPNMEGAPEVFLDIRAQTSVIDALRPVPPSSYSGPTDIAVIIGGLATQMGLGFVNNGVKCILPSPYYPGTARDQAIAAAQAANCNIIWDDGSAPMQSGADNPTVPSGTSAGSGLPKIIIYPKGGTIGGQIPLISPDTGMVGYPTVTSQGIIVQSVYNPSLAFGGSFRCKSSLTVANGTWGIFNLTHDLESELPGGKWFTRVEGSALGAPAPIANAK
jgi:hypothetical protein